MAKQKKTPRDLLGEELINLIPGLDEEGLAFLIEQARVHLYNMEVLRHESAMAQIEARGKKGPAKTEAPKGDGGFVIQKSEGSGAYHVSRRGKYKMFTEEEMLAMVQIAKAREPLLDVAARLCDWFERERPDTFADLDLGDRFDPSMKEFVKFLRAKFAVRKT